jgi:hypothetical protein
MGEQTSLNQLFSFLACRVISPTLSIVLNLISIGQGLRCGGGPKFACSHWKEESSITLLCTTVHAVMKNDVNYLAPLEFDLNRGLPLMY